MSARGISGVVVAILLASTVARASDHPVLDGSPNQLSVEATLGAGTVLELGQSSWTALEATAGLRFVSVPRSLVDGVVRLRATVPLGGSWNGGADGGASVGIHVPLREWLYGAALLGFGASLATVDSDMTGFFLGPTGTLELGAELPARSFRPLVVARVHAHFLKVGAWLLSPTVSIGLTW